MTITFSMTARDLVTRAMQERGVLALGKAPKSSEMDYGIETLNLMLKTWAMDGISLWGDSDATATVIGGDDTVALSPRPIDVFDARLVMSATHERPMTRWEKSEYATLPNKTTVGEPLIYTPIYSVSGLSLKVWPVPATNRTIAYSYSRVIEDVTQPSDPIDVPQMWLEAVKTILASKLTAFGGDPTDLARLDRDAERLERKIRDFDRPAAYDLSAC